MKLFFSTYRNSFIIILFFILAEWIINPIGEFSLNDDWAYAKSVETYIHKGCFEIGYWPAMTLYAHVLWGVLFVKIFGFSFTVLRFSILLLGLGSILIIQKLAFQITQNRQTALLSSLVIFVSPLFMNLSNSYMTDVSFLFSVLASVYFFYQCFYTDKLKYVYLGFLFYVIALFVRQLAVTVPLAFIAICLLDVVFNKTTLKLFVVSMALFFGSLVILFFFEKSIYPSLSDFSSYQGIFFSKSKIQITSLDFFDNLYKRFSLLLLYVGLTVFPILIINIKTLFIDAYNSSLIRKGLALLFIILICVVYHLFPIGNVLYNSGIGLETTPDTFHFKMNIEHTYNPILFETIRVISLLGATLFILQIINHSKDKASENWFSQKNKFSLFIGLILLAYVFLFAMFSSFYDRYALSFFSLALLLMVNQINFKLNKPRFVMIVLFIYSLFSILATKDYFNYNRIKENIITDLTQHRHVKVDDIHGGFEFMMWNFYEKDGWNRYWDHRGYNYQITFGENLEPYHTIEKHPYRRYFPFKVDTLYLIKKDEE